MILDLKSPHPFWLVQDGLVHTYPPLAGDATAEVVVLGAGITGAILAERLTREGFDVLVLDSRDVGQGSTSASTAILQYEIDTHLTDLSRMRGQHDAERAYHLCRSAIATLAELAATVPECGFEPKVSLYVASSNADIKPLRDEAAARNACGIRCEFLQQPELGGQYPLTAPAAIVSRDAAACDPYRLAHRLLQQAISGGARVFDRTLVTKVEPSGFGVRLMTDRGGIVAAQHLVLATGYETQCYLKEKVTNLLSSFAIATQPLPSLAPWNPQWMLWESARPYFYLRTTGDGRLLAGGEDVPFQDAEARDALVWDQGQLLLTKLRKLLPDLDAEVEFAWGGTFGETRDGLAYIGESPEMPRTSFALGFGGNGIVFSAIAADVIADQLRGRPNADARLFRFGR
jgi:glycine/D-amino acid oxidase-like deaminating enzyme